MRAINVDTRPMSTFASTIMNGKYAHTKPSGHKETWSEISYRVSHSVMEKYVSPSIVKTVYSFIDKRQLMPGGRYLYAAGRKYPQINNCYLFIAEDSREGWADTMFKNTSSLMTGGGVGNVYSKLREEGALVGGMGGTSTGPIALMQMVNEAGRHIMQGGSRRSAIWAGLHWWHPDVFKFIQLKDWSDEVKALKLKDFNFPAAMDMTNISVALDGEFFQAFENPYHSKHSHAVKVYWMAVRHMCETGEPGFSIDTDENEGEWGRNAPVVADTNVLTKDGYKPVKELIGKPTSLWTGKQWADNVEFKLTKKQADIVKVRISNGKTIRCDPEHPFLVVRGRDLPIERIPAGQLKVMDKLHTSPPSNLYKGEGLRLTVVLSVEPDGKEDVYCCDVGVEEHSFQAEGVIISNCTEVTTPDDSDMCLAEGTMILTENGYVPIETLIDNPVKIASKLNDQIIFQTPDKVWSNGVKPVFHIKTKGGRELRATGNHPVLTDSGWKDVDQLTMTDKIAINAAERSHTGSSLNAEYYTLGWLIGDGWFTEKKGFGFVFGCEEDKDTETIVVDYMRSTYGKPGQVKIQQQANGVRCMTISTASVKEDFIKKYGVTCAKATGKRIPEKVFTASVQEKQSFLAGLFAADGSAKGNRRGRVMLSSNSRKLLNDTQLLLDDLGIHSWIGWFKVKGRNDQGTLTISGKSSKRFLKLVGFGAHAVKQALLEERLTDKKDATGKIHSFRDIAQFVEIESIKADGECEVFDIALPNHHHLIANGLIVHNCNLSSLNLARFNTVDEFEDAVYHATCFLLCGTMYSPLPIPSMYKVREKNRRLGLGLMGIHEWLLRRGYKYGPNQELEKWLQAYERASDYAKYWASNVFGISVPVKTRAVAPTGTISIVAETTSGLEPIFAAAQKRRYMSQDNSKNWCYQYIIDACAERLISDGVDPDSIEDAYDLAEDIERRVEMQSWIQRYVDHSISSTINMPSWGSSCNNPNTVDSFGKTLYKYLPKLRGITVYPDGARGGQPLNRVSYAEAIKHIGKEFTESGESVSVKTEEFGNERSCVNGLCGI